MLLEFVNPSLDPPPHLLDSVLSSLSIREAITLAADRAELDAYNDSQRPFRSQHHHGIRAQQQMVMFLGEQLDVLNLGFLQEDTDNQVRLISPPGLFPAQVRFVIHRAMPAGAGFRIGSRRVHSRELINQNHMQLSLMDAPEGHAPSNLWNIWIIVSTWLAINRMKVSLVLAERVVNGVLYGDHRTCYEGSIGLPSATLSLSADQISATTQSPTTIVESITPQVQIEELPEEESQDSLYEDDDFDQSSATEAAS
jgi:hypothetical protein